MPTATSADQASRTSSPRPRNPLRVGRRTLPDRVAFSLLVSIVVAFLAGSSAPTPLYGLYQQEWGFSPITTTIVFAVYAVAVLAALLIVGSVSDHIGRKPVLIIAIAVQAVTMLIFATATGVPALYVARVVQGLSTGAAVGAIGAGMLDLDRAKGTIANAVGPMIGTAAGSIGSAVLVQFLPAPTRVVYVVLFAVFVLQALGVLLMAEPSVRRPGALASLRPQFALPADVRAPLLKAAPALIATWALLGFYASLGPALVGKVTGSHSYVLGGSILTVLLGCGALNVLALRNVAARTLLRMGACALLVGNGLALVAIVSDSAALFFIAAVVTGSGFAGAFQGTLRMVVPLAAPDERAGVLSIVYIISYLALGLPVVVAGFLVVRQGGLLAPAKEYGLAMMVLAALALAGTMRNDRRRAAEPVRSETA